MVKCFGGVLIVIKVLGIDVMEEELFVVRNFEKEVYDFIGLEMDEIFEILLEGIDELGWVIKWVVLVLKS